MEALFCLSILKAMHERLKKQTILVTFYSFNFIYETKALFCIEQASMTHNSQCKIVKADWHCCES